MELLEKAKDLINQFCLEEYGDVADFSDLSRIEVAYDFDTKTQIVVNLIDYRLEAYKGNRLTSVYGYNSLEVMVENELEWLDYDALVVM